VVVGSLPLWAAALVLCLVYGLMASSLHNLRRAIYMNRGAAGGGCIQYAAWDSIFSLVALIITGWLAYHHIPLVHDFFQHFRENVASMWNNIVNSVYHAGAEKLPTGS
jgi:hypothetical protein